MATTPKPITEMLEKTSLVDDDLLEVVDSAETNKSLKNKKVKGATLKGYIGGAGKETIYQTKSGSVLNGSILNKPGGIVVTGDNDAILSPYDATVNEIQVEFDVTALTTAGDCRIFISGGYGGNEYRDITVNATGHYRSTNLLSNPITLDKGDSYYAQVSFQGAFSATIQDCIVGVILEGA